jgi:hypothetical protein
MKRLIFYWVIFLIATAFLPSESQAISGSFTTKISPNYVVNSQARVYNGWESQTNLVLNLPAHFWAEIIVFQGLEGYGPSRMGDEIQYIAGRKNPLSANVILDLGIIYHDLNVPPPGLFHMKGDIIKPFGELSTTYRFGKTNLLTPSLRIEAPFPAKDQRPEPGLYAYFKMRLESKLTDSLAVSQLGWLLKDDGASGRDPIWLARYSVSLRWEFGKNIFLIPAYMINAPLENTSKKDGRETFHTPSLALQYKF